MKRVLIVIFFCIPLLTKAQSPFQIDVETRSGYEYNVFNANKNKILVSEEGDSTLALQSGFFQHFNLSAKWKKKIKKNQLSFKARTRYDYFPELSAANLFRPEVSFGYSYKLNRKSSLFFKSRYLLYKTNRIPDDTEVISVPVGYQRLNADLGFKFKPIKNNKSQIQFSVLEKQYAEREESGLKYGAFGINFQTKQRFKRKRKPSNYLALELDFQRRNYLRTIFGEEPEEDEMEDEEFEMDSTSQRVWQYHTAKLEYTYGYSKAVKIRTGLALQQRLDILDKKFGYNQWQPFVKLEIEKGRLNFNWKVEGVFRSFSNLKATKSGNELLKHRYLRTSLSVNYAVSKHLDFTVRGNLRKRWRNFSDGATSFLPYTNGMISAGVKYRF